ncbi:hypothetical protein BASA62_003413 [Batrachochytrium salamandrivorans]|nr:hypothetical protein BASA62_003413 [Batrachochytrium salamandrivorans]
MRELDFLHVRGVDGNQLGSALAVQLRAKGLGELHFVNCDFVNETLAVIGVELGRIKRLDIGRNLNDASVELIALALQSPNSEMKELALTYNIIAGSIKTHLVTALKHPNCNLVKLSLSDLCSRGQKWRSIFRKRLRVVLCCCRGGKRSPELVQREKEEPNQFDQKLHVTITASPCLCAPLVVLVHLRGNGALDFAQVHGHNVLTEGLGGAYALLLKALAGAKPHGQHAVDLLLLAPPHPKHGSPRLPGHVLGDLRHVPKGLVQHLGAHDAPNRDKQLFNLLLHPALLRSVQHVLGRLQPLPQLFKQQQQGSALGLHVPPDRVGLGRVKKVLLIKLEGLIHTLSNQSTFGDVVVVALIRSFSSITSGTLGSLARSRRSNSCWQRTLRGKETLKKCPSQKRSFTDLAQHCSRPLGGHWHLPSVSSVPKLIKFDNVKLAFHGHILASSQAVARFQPNFCANAKADQEADLCSKQEADQGTNRKANQSTNQGAKQEADQGTNQSANQGAKQETNQSADQSAKQETNQSANQSASQSVNQSANQGANQSANRETKQEAEHNAEQEINRETHASFDKGSDRETHAPVDKGAEQTKHDANQTTSHDDNQATKHDANQTTKHDADQATNHGANQPANHDDNQTTKHDANQATKHDANQTTHQKAYRQGKL